MKIHNIVDFTDTGIYKHLKLIKPSNYTDEQLVMAHVYKNHDVFCTLKNSHVFVIKDNTSISIPIGLKAMYDGIYDIWLQDCCNVHSVSVVFNDVEIAITEYKQIGDTIRIPLAFMSDADKEGVKHLFTHTESAFFLRKRVSYIPSVAMQLDTLSIVVNSGASCKVNISTVYFGIHYRRELVHSNNIFYVNGVPLITRSSTAQKHTEKSSILSQWFSW